jgi:polysaccharide biosynthesis protein PslG
MHRMRWQLRLSALMVLTACHARTGEQPSGAAGSPREFTKPVSFAILEDYDKGDDLGAIARDFALFKELGVPVWRGSFGWDDYEPAPGRYDFGWLDRFVALADSMEITLRPYLGYTPAWAGRAGRDEHAWNDPPRRVEDWARFVSTIASRYRTAPSIRSYEIYNEENVSLWWEGTAGEYARVLRAGAHAIRKADPDAQILLGGMVWPDLDWLEVACGTGRASFDVLPFHAYPETWTPDSITVENYLGPGYRAGFLPEADQQCGRRSDGAHGQDPFPHGPPPVSCVGVNISWCSDMYRLPGKAVQSPMFPDTIHAAALRCSSLTPFSVLPGLEAIERCAPSMVRPTRLIA